MDDWIDYFRFIFAVAVFVLGCYGIYDLLVNGFSIPVIIGAIVCFGLSHYLKPKFRRDNKPDAYDWIDAVDFIIDIPFKFIIYSIRAIGKVAKNDTFDV